MVCEMTTVMMLTTLMSLTVEKLGSRFIKVEDIKQQHCPLYKSFTAMPAVHIGRPLGVSIFEPSSNGKEAEQSQAQCSHRQLELTDDKEQPHRYYYCCCRCCQGRI